MGWGRALFLGEIGNQMDIQDTGQSISRLKLKLISNESKDRSQDKRLAQLEQENDELKLYLASLAQLLVRKGTLEASEIEDLVVHIDSKD